MKIIIAPSGSDGMPSSAPWAVWEVTSRRLVILSMVLVSLLAMAVYSSARGMARGWLQEKAPIAVSLVQEIEERQVEENRRRWESQAQFLEDEIAGLRAGITELRGRSEALASRMGLDGFTQGAPGELECQAAEELAGVEILSDSVADVHKTAAETTAGVQVAVAAPVDVNTPPGADIAPYQKAFDFYRRRYEVLLQHGANMGVTFDTVPLNRPLIGKNWLSSRFGMRRDPLTGRRAFHAGYDYAARRGTPVVAGATGLVTYVGRLGNYGNAVRISHGEGVSTLYGHLLSASVERGDYVRRGEQVGKVGSTGRSTGPHLHYEVRFNNRPRPVAGAIKKLRQARALPQEWEL